MPNRGGAGDGAPILSPAILIALADLYTDRVIAALSPVRHPRNGTDDELREIVRPVIKAAIGETEITVNKHRLLRPKKPRRYA